MTSFSARAALIACVLGAAAMPSLGASSAASSVAESLTSSVGGSSTSLQTSSNSSTGTRAVASGDYQLTEVVALAERPGMVRMTLQALTAPSEAPAAREFFLILPQVAFNGSGLSTGQTVAAQARPFGMAFANAQTQAAFFLVLHDEWLRELQTTPVVL